MVDQGLLTTYLGRAGLMPKMRNLIPGMTDMDDMLMGSLVTPLEASIIPLTGARRSREHDIDR